METQSYFANLTTWMVEKNFNRLLLYFLFLLFPQHFSLSQTSNCVSIMQLDYELEIPVWRDSWRGRIDIESE